MKKIIAASCVLGLFMIASSLVIAAGKHPRLAQAHKLIQEAIVKITEAQKANEYDMAGHAQKAKDLLVEAEKEVKMAKEAAK